MLFGPSVTIYTTPTCGYCQMLKRYLQQKGVRYVEKDVSRDAAAAAEMTGKSRQSGVPVTIINGRAIVGFNKNAINRLLGIK
jgi:glutaredoxin 3